jgi:DNA-binding MarR family transcriptional regulator
VYLALEGHGPATVETLALATGQSRRAVVNALSDLEEAGLVTARPDETDPRRQLWEPAD